MAHSQCEVILALALRRFVRYAIQRASIGESLTEAIGAGTPTGRAMGQITGGLAELERNLSNRTISPLAAGYATSTTPL
jgi:hypothetical protein